MLDGQMGCQQIKHLQYDHTQNVGDYDSWAIVTKCEAVLFLLLLTGSLVLGMVCLKLPRNAKLSATVTWRKTPFFGGGGPHGIVQTYHFPDNMYNTEPSKLYQINYITCFFLHCMIYIRSISSSAVENYKFGVYIFLWSILLQSHQYREYVAEWFIGYTLVDVTQRGGVFHHWNMKLSPDICWFAWYRLISWITNEKLNRYPKFFRTKHFHTSYIIL